MPRIPIILAACAALGACAHNGVQLTTTQALYVAEAGVDGANQAATVAANAGVLKGPAAAKVKGYIDTANQAASTAYVAYVAGDQARANTELAAALANVASAKQGSGN